MDNRFKEIRSELGKMTSSQAADWLIENYPVDSSEYGTAIALLPHRSWKRSDQVRLAKHYMSKIPFASAKVYEAFASFMSIELLISEIKKKMPQNGSDLSLLMYHLVPVLELHAKNDTDRELIQQFTSKVLPIV